MSAAGVVSCIIPADIAIVQTTLAPNVNVAQGLFLEMVCDNTMWQKGPRTSNPAKDLQR
jgi:hypothetical protein